MEGLQLTISTSFDQKTQSGYLSPLQFPTNLLMAFLFQSGFKPLHSTDSVILKVSNNLLLTDDSEDSAILMLLDLMAAFNTVDHRIVISRREQCVGIKGTALEWFRSYNSVCDAVSSSAPLPLCSPSGIYSRTYCVFPVPSSPRVLLQKIWHLVSLLC